IYQAPQTPFVFDFLGRTNAFNCSIEGGRTKLGDKVLAVEGDVPDGPGVAFVRPHDIVLAPPNGDEKTEDAKLPGHAIVRFVSALGERAAVELLYERRLIEAESSREKLKDLKLGVGDKCDIRLRSPRIYARAEAERQAKVVERPARPRLRLRRRES